MSVISFIFFPPSFLSLSLYLLYFCCVQSFFRDQPESIANVNLIGEVATFAQHYYGNIRPSNVELVIQVLQTLVEVCVVRSMLL